MTHDEHKALEAWAQDSLSFSASDVQCALADDVYGAPPAEDR